MKILSVGAELFHADGQRNRHDMTKLTVALRKFANAPKERKVTTVHNNITLYDLPDPSEVSVANIQIVI